MRFLAEFTRDPGRFQLNGPYVAPGAGARPTMGARPHPSEALIREKGIVPGVFVTGDPYFMGTRRVRRVTDRHEVLVEGSGAPLNPRVLTVVTT